MNNISTKALVTGVCAAAMCVFIVWSATEAAVSASACRGAPASENLTAGIGYSLQVQASPSYPDSSAFILTDGRHGSPDDLTSGWMGFDHGEPAITFDLGTSCRIDRVEASFLEATDWGVHLPGTVDVSVSADGAEWTYGGRLTPSADKPGAFDVDTPGLTARHVRIEAERNEWLLVDEVAVYGTAPRTRVVAAYRPVKEVLVVTSYLDEYSESRSRLVNLLEGMGLPFDIIEHQDVGQTALRGYQLVIVAMSGAEGAKLDERGEREIIGALADGVNFLWIGPGIWGTFKTTDLPEALGLRYVDQDWSSKMGIERATFTNLAGRGDWLAVQEEIVCRVSPVRASVEQWYRDADNQYVSIPFITRYQANRHSGTVVYISLPMLDYWKTDQTEDTFARGEVLFKYIRRLTGEGTVGKHPALDAKEGVFILRLEDHTPGGEAMGHAKRFWFIRLAHLIELTEKQGLPLSIALVPKFAHPYKNEFHDWLEDELGIAIVREMTREVFASGGSLIVHGYKHQNGTGADDFSGDDWEMWDEDTKKFLPLAEQQRITNAAFAEVARTWGMTPTIWETPHYISNADTFKAARATGFLYATESDTKLFPNRDGWLNHINGLMLNLPETGFDYPEDPDEIKEVGLLKQKYLLPRLMRMQGQFHVFFHNNSVNQFRALENLLTTAKRYDLWQPSMEGYGVYWQQRERVGVEARINRVSRRILADVTGAFEGFSLSIRLPDGAAPGEVTIDGQAVEAISRQLDGVWYVYPVLGDSERSEVLVTYRAAPSEGLTQ